jgi:general secretion pathway protein G
MNNSELGCEPVSPAGKIPAMRWLRFAFLLLMMSLPIWYGCGGGGGGGSEFVGTWVKNGDTVSISKNGKDFLVVYEDANLRSTDKLVASYAGEKLTTTFPLIGPTALVIDKTSGNLVFSGVGEFKKLSDAEAAKVKEAEAAKIKHLAQKDQIAAATADIAILKTALNMFEIDNGYYPRGKEGLLALIQQPPDAKHWHRYLDFAKLPLDPWGNPYVYEYPGKHNRDGYDVFSMGPDGQVGGGDDIGNWPPSR